MIHLIPEEVNFIISTTDILVKYMERSPIILTIDTLDIENYHNRDRYNTTNIVFDTVAELRCCSVNFFEAFYDQYEIFKMNESTDDFSFWEENGYHPDSGLYQMDNSSWLRQKVEIYDPLKKLGLKHYLVVGNDSYIEILADSYEVRNT